MRRIVVSILTVVAILIASDFAIENASAGELVRGKRTIRTSSSLGRSVRTSTFAMRRARNARIASDSRTDLRSTNPYEARILDQQQAQHKYELKYAKWENKVQKQELKAQAKAQKAADREAKRAERAAEREQRRLEKLQAKKDKDKARAERDQARRTGTTVAAKKAPGVPVVGSGATGVEQAPRRLSLWQRLKRWLFGASS